MGVLLVPHTPWPLERKQPGQDHLTHPQNSSCGCGRCFQAAESTQLLQLHTGAVLGFWAQTKATCKEKPQWKPVKGQPYPDSSYDPWKEKTRQFEDSSPPQAVRDNVGSYRKISSFARLSEEGTALPQWRAMAAASLAIRLADLDFLLEIKELL